VLDPTVTHLAYLDPGSGSLLIQALVASIAGGTIALRRYWARIWPKKRSGGEEKDGAASDPNE